MNVRATSRLAGDKFDLHLVLCQSLAKSCGKPHLFFEVLAGPAEIYFPKYKADPCETFGAVGSKMLGAAL
jgi:hypothetical protein